MLPMHSYICRVNDICYIHPPAYLIDFAQILHLKFQDRTKVRRESKNIFLGGPLIITPKIFTYNTVKFKLNIGLFLFIYFKINQFNIDITT